MAGSFDIRDSRIKNNTGLPGPGMHFFPAGFPVLRLTCLKNGKIDLSERKIGAWTKEAAKQFLVLKGDFFVSRGNGSLTHVGRGGLVEDEPDGVAYPDTLIRVRVRKDVIEPTFLRQVWSSRSLREQIESAAHTTAGIWTISQKDLEKLVVPIPPVTEQQEIVRRVEALFALADRIEGRLVKAQEGVDRLTPSLLAKAFRGELVPNEAGLARQERREYEPASVLLERLQRERNAVRSDTREKRRPPAALERSAQAVTKSRQGLTQQRRSMATARSSELVRKRQSKKSPQHTR